LGAIEDVEETLGTQVLGIIPQADAKDIREGLKDKCPEGIKESTEKQLAYLVSHFVPKSMMAESFRALRTNVQFKDAEKKIQTIGVASTSPEEGKTLVAINLALTMAQAGMKVLLVGSDLRKPAIDRVFGVEMTPGLTDVLMGNYPWRDTVKAVTDIIMGQMSPDEVMMTPGLDNLHIVTSGPIPPNPAELIDSGRLTDFIEEAKEDYDMIVFDSTPILSTADAAILGAKVDGVLLVYRVGTVSRGLLKRSTAQLEQVQCNLMGVVLNGMRPDVSPDFQDYKYYTYYYSYGEQEKQRKRRERIKGFSFLRRKGDSQRKEEEKISIGEEGERLPKKRARKLNRGRLALMLVAMAFLAAGILWQSGIIDPFKILEPKTPVKKDQVKPAVKKGPSKKAIQREPKRVSTKPKRTVSRETGGPQVKTPIPKSPPVKKQVADVKTPVVKKETSKTVVSRKSEAISPKPKPTVSVEKPVVKPVTPVKKGTSDTAIRKKPEMVSTKAKRPVIVKKPAPKPQQEASIPKSPASSKDVAVTKTPPSSKKIVSYPYSLYLGSFRTLERANKAISLYTKEGLAPYCTKVDFDEKGVWYRVFTGHFENRERAERFKKDHRLKEGTVKKTGYANLIGIYTSLDQLQNKMLSLKKLGYSPYAIKDRDGKSRLFIGAFITKEGAKKQYHDLRSSGIQSQVVQR
jgi:capsular exopolysaccharide synthesis family protein